MKEEWQELDELKPESSSPADAAQCRDKLLEMIHQIVPYLMQHNAEAEACDVLMEIERLDLLQQYVDRSAFPRVCLYLRRSAYFLLLLFSAKLSTVFNVWFGILTECQLDLHIGHF